MTDHSHPDNCPCCGEKMIKGIAVKCRVCGTISQDLDKDNPEKHALQLGWGVKNGITHCPKCLGSTCLPLN